MYLLLVWLPAPSSRICSLHFEQKDITNNRISPTIAFCRDELQLQDFAGSEATCEFLLTFNDLFDVLNSKSVRGKFLKGPLFEKTQKYWIPVLDNARKYILELCHNSNKPVVKGPRKQPFLGFVSLIDSVKLFDLDAVDSWVDIYDRGQNLESDFKKNVCTYMSGYIQRKLQSKHDCVYCEENLKNSETNTCDLIEKKNLGGLVKPHTDIESIVNVTDCILSQKIKGTMFFGYLIFFFNI